MDGGFVIPRVLALAQLVLHRGHEHGEQASDPVYQQVALVLALVGGLAILGWYGYRLTR